MPNSLSGPSRRSFLASAAVATAAVGGVPLLSACSGEGSRGQEGRVAEDELQSILPTYRASDAAVEPDIPSENGSSPGYTRWIPDGELGVSVPEPRGGGAELTAMTPLWGTPPRPGNPFWTAMDEAIGVRMNWRIQDGASYGEKLAATLASSDIPDLVCIPDWNLTGQIPQAVSSRFADLGPFLSGDKVLDYANLAAIPTEAWGPSVFGGALRGLPQPANPLGAVAPFYRQDIFDANGWTPPTTAREFLDFAKDITSPGNRVWACEDMKWFGGIMYGSPDWELVDGRLVSRYETDLYLEALEWNRSLFEAGVVHPDAIGATGDPGVRFTAGEVMMYIGGPGGWYPLAVEQQKSNPDFRMNAFDFFAPDGGDPVLYRDNGSRIWTFVNKNLSEDRIRAALELANFAAAPYGTVEQRLKQWGIEGTHYTLEDGLPVRTEQGNAQVVPESYTFICSPQAYIAFPDLPQVVEDMAAWQQRNFGFGRDWLFGGRQIQEPARLSGISDGFSDLEDDVSRGRASIRDLRNAVDEWRRNGGDELRDFYQRLLDEEDGAA
ncbi:extracellular solute-binding protein [Streptomyces litchfieldiae]|uniref:Extracellular solute-binding protein n=1 Tax=Streptomyces litchfieldiae TaxID=3075543 RepID=A0ABU2N1F1_9ACTN|nr:extracellular solute-binding protein [Streptomyces sp. DSM 44938]MDT0347427.1 extracellular solute-binding protein [Streptomyces sp. DSM 44938]